MGEAMSGAKATIRPYHVEDLEPVMDAWRKANAVAHPFLTEGYVSQVEREVREVYIPNAETYVIEDCGAVVGFIALLGNEIGGLFLDPSRHGRGFGRALVDYAFAIKGPLSVDVFRANEIGRPFYERYGFKLLAEERHEPTGESICKMVMACAADNRA